MLAFLHTKLLGTLILAAELPKVDPTTDAPLYDKLQKIVNSFAGLIVLALFALGAWGIFTVVRGLSGDRHGGWGKGVGVLLGSVIGIWLMFNFTPVAQQFSNYLGS